MKSFVGLVMFEAESYIQRDNLWKLPPERGEFLDFYGNTLAGNLKVYQLHVVPEQVEDFKYLMVRLKDILQLDDKKFSKIIKRKNKQKPWETLVISENLTWDQFSKVNFYFVF